MVTSLTAEKTDLSEYMYELDGMILKHRFSCELGSRCQTCSDLADSNLRSLIGLARMEYEQKINCIDKSFKDLCVYCGSFSEHRDHLLPLPWTGPGVRAMVPTVPACGKCNRTISDYSSPIIYDRSMLVASRIRKKYAKQLKITDKTENQFLQFEGNMQKSLRARQYERQHLRSRLLILESGGLPEVGDDVRVMLLEAKYEHLAS